MAEAKRRLWRNDGGPIWIKGGDRGPRRNRKVIERGQTFRATEDELPQATLRQGTVVAVHPTREELGSGEEGA